MHIGLRSHCVLPPPPIHSYQLEQCAYRHTRQDEKSMATGRRHRRRSPRAPGPKRQSRRQRRHSSAPVPSLNARASGKHVSIRASVRSASGACSTVSVLKVGKAAAPRDRGAAKWVVDVSVAADAALAAWQPTREHSPGRRELGPNSLTRSAGKDWRRQSMNGSRPRPFAAD
jgi:hypothetical protein